MTYIQTILFFLSVLIFLAGLLLLELSIKGQDAGVDVTDAEYRPAEESGLPRLEVHVGGKGGSSWRLRTIRPR